jgi:hypothetical protein
MGVLIHSSVRRGTTAVLLLLAAACGENQTYPDRKAYEAPPGMPLSCLPNLDGVLEDRELKAAVGVTESLLVSPSGVQRAVNLSGTQDADGHRVWDLAADYADDQVAKLAAADLAGQWFQSAFPQGQYVVPIDAGGTVLGVYSDDGSNLLLHGVASAKENPPEGKTLLAYQLPIALYRYPLQVGKSWVSAGEVRNATLRGLPYAGRDTYEVSIDAAGRLELPDLTFTQVLRARTHITIEPVAGPTVSRRQVSWLFECFGEVARAVSLDNETQDDFTTTSELRRLGL